MNYLRKSRGEVPSGLVLGLIVLAITIVVGSIAYSETYTKLDALRDSDFSAAANTTIAGVDTDFWSGVDLTRILLIVIPSSAVLAALYFYFRGKA